MADEECNRRLRLPEPDMGARRQDAVRSARAGADGGGRWRLRSLNLAEGENAVRRPEPLIFLLVPMA